MVLQSDVTPAAHTGPLQLPWWEQSTQQRPAHEPCRQEPSQEPHAETSTSTVRVKTHPEAQGAVARGSTPAPEPWQLQQGGHPPKKRRATRAPLAELLRQPPAPAPAPAPRAQGRARGRKIEVCGSCSASVPSSQYYVPPQYVFHLYGALPPARAQRPGAQHPARALLHPDPHLSAVHCQQLPFTPWSWGLLKHSYVCRRPQQCLTPAAPPSPPPG